ncbi:hypothetical protein BDZ45DRAFT_76242 [Acephala macrosclerotiorum]|nr:hypothetical protein BDZ45DRAFT_76242 [Acephala macrosclerotiorum]
MSTSSASSRNSDTSTTPTSPTTTIESEDQRPEESLPWILYHILNPECASELPLSIMFCFNSGQKPLPDSLREAQSYWQLDRQGYLLNKFISSLTDQEPWRIEVGESAAAKPLVRKTPEAEDNGIDEAQKQTMGAIVIKTRGAEHSSTDKVQELEKHDPLETIPENEPAPYAHPRDHFSRPENQALLRKVRFVTPDPEKRKSFKSVLDKYITKDSQETEAQGLPYHVVRDFCLKQFPSEYECADFSNALTVLDYLRDLEFTRRAQLREVGRRWGITEYNWKEAFTSNKSSMAWFLNMQLDEQKTQQWFANIYVDLRIWIMIDELKSPHFSRKEILAKLNTLYPPVTLSVPSDEISIKQLQWHRKIIFGWILAVEKEGPQKIIEVEEIMFKGKHSWHNVTHSLQNYLKHAHIHIAYAKHERPDQFTIAGVPAKVLPRIPPVNPPSWDVGFVEGECECCPKGSAKTLLHPDDAISPEDRERWKRIKLRNQASPVKKPPKKLKIDTRPYSGTRTSSSTGTEFSTSTATSSTSIDTRPSTSSGVPRADAPKRQRASTTKASGARSAEPSQRQSAVTTKVSGTPIDGPLTLPRAETSKPYGFIPPSLEDLSDDPSVVPPSLFATRSEASLPFDGGLFLTLDPNAPTPAPSLRKRGSNWSLKGLKKGRERVDSKIDTPNPSEYSANASSFFESPISSVRKKPSIREFAKAAVAGAKFGKGKKENISPQPSPSASEFFENVRGTDFTPRPSTEIVQSPQQSEFPRFEELYDINSEDWENPPLPGELSAYSPSDEEIIRNAEKKKAKQNKNKTPKTSPVLSEFQFPNVGTESGYSTTNNNPEMKKPLRGMRSIIGMFGTLGKKNKTPTSSPIVEKFQFEDEINKGNLTKEEVEELTPKVERTFSAMYDNHDNEIENAKKKVKSKKSGINLFASLRKNKDKDMRMEEERVESPLIQFDKIMAPSPQEIQERVALNLLEEEARERELVRMEEEIAKMAEAGFQGLAQEGSYLNLNDEDEKKKNLKEKKSVRNLFGVLSMKEKNREGSGGGGGSAGPSEYEKNMSSTSFSHSNGRKVLVKKSSYAV